MATGDTPPRIPSRVCPKRGGKGSLTFRGTTKSWPRRRRRRTHHRQRTRPDTCRRCSGNQAVNTRQHEADLTFTDFPEGAKALPDACDKCIAGESYGLDLPRIGQEAQLPLVPDRDAGQKRLDHLIRDWAPAVHQAVNSRRDLVAELDGSVRQW